MKSPKILIGASSFGNKDPKPLIMLKEAGVDYRLNPYGRKLTKAELLELLPGMDGLIAGLESIDREVMEKSGIRVVSRCGSGMANVDMDAAASLGVKVYGVPDGPTLAVSEMTVGCLLTLMREVPQMDRALHQGRWDKRVGKQLRGKTALIIGYGRIGQTTGGMLKALGVTITAFDPWLKDENMPLVTNLATGLAVADVVILHNSGEEEILDEAAFQQMKPGVFLLNASRGAAVNDVALMAALDSGKVAGAWLDALVPEPYAGPLCRYEQVILTPHVGSYTHEGRLRMECATVENLLNGLQLVTVQSPL